MRIATIGPLRTPLSLKTGLDPKSPLYGNVINSLPQGDKELVIPNHARATTYRDFESAEKDDLDLRLAVWSPKPGPDGADVQFHIYPAGVTIVHIEFEHADTEDIDALELDVQRFARDCVDHHAPRLNALLCRIRKSLPDGYIEGEKETSRVSSDDFSWISRAIIVSDAERQTPFYQRLIPAWLENTAQPEDANAILAGDKDYSITWLNYVVVERDRADTRYLFSAVRTAQFFYAAHDLLNERAYHALSNAPFEKNVRTVERSLRTARERAQMLRIVFDVQMGFLSRRKRRLVDDLTDTWDYDVLINNGERILSASESKISEIISKRTERSSFFTDLILVAIALVTVVEVSLYMTQYSREVMSRPALAYTDSGVSWILSLVASVDADTMLLGGAFIMIILVILYVYWKTRR
ncbi:MAG: hypothetical protein AAFX54_11180 [Pseudomonadota bacterium]